MSTAGGGGGGRGGARMAADSDTPCTSREVVSIVADGSEFSIEEVVTYGQLDQLWHLRLLQVLETSPYSTIEEACDEAIKQLTRRLLVRKRKVARFIQTARLVAGTVVHCTTISRVWNLVLEELLPLAESDPILEVFDGMKYRYSFVVFVSRCGTWPATASVKDAEKASALPAALLREADTFLDAFLTFVLHLWRHRYTLENHVSFGTKFRKMCEKSSVQRRKYLSAVHRACAGHCETCGTSASKLEAPLQSCSACKAVYYCGIKCQRKDWKKHREECKRLKAEKKRKKKEEPVPWSIRIDRNNKGSVKTGTKGVGPRGGGPEGAGP